MLTWLFPLALLVVVVALAVAPGWIAGLIGIVVFGLLGYWGVAWYYRRYQQFHNPDDPQ
jgi:positive regulator of sigma E activity